MAQRSARTAAAPAAKPAAPAGAARAQPAASTRQAGGAAVNLAGELAPGVLDLKAMGDSFKPPEPIASFLDAHPRAQVQARFGTLAQGPIEVQTQGKGRHRVHRQRLPLVHPLFSRIAESAPELAPCLVIDVNNGKLEGRVGLAAGSKLDSFESRLGKAPDILGLAGFRFPALTGVVNTLSGGRLKVGITGVPVVLGQAFNGKLSLLAEDETISFEASATVAARGAATGTLEMKRAADGLVTGRATLALQLPKNFSGSVEVAWDGRAATGEGKVAYKGEKLSGEVTLRLMERAAALQLEEQKKAPPEQAPAPAAPAAAASNKKVDYVLFGEGDLAFAFNSWLNGTARVIVDPKGYVTLIGKITPQREFELFPQKDYVKQLFKIEVRATYGLPVVGNIFIFANVGMDAFAKIGPARFYKIIAQGTYSTDPAKCQDFSIQGTFNMSAAAGVRLRGEAGAGLEILGHDIKAGAGVNGIAGIKGYAEATPIIGYREKAAPGEDKKGEWFIRGEVEIAAQPFLGLSGDLFVELDAPWWSPLSDDRWTWPLGGKEWPLGGPLGIGASVDYVFGSGQWPKVDLKPVEFSPDKFMTDLYSDKAKSGKGGDVDKPGQWKEKNSAAASPPPKASPKGNAAPGKAPALAAAKPKVRPGGTGKGGKPADPNARTAGGKTVKQYQDEAVKNGKKAPGGDAKAGGKEQKPAKDGTAAADAKQALAALDHVTAAYAANGASKAEVETGVKAVRRKFSKVFKSLQVVDGGTTWDYEFEMSPKQKTKGPKSKPAPGSEKNPFQIVWPKRPSAGYASIWLAPADVTNGKLYSQPQLQKMPGAKQFDANDGKAVFGKETIGIKKDWITKKGRRFGPGPHEGRVENEKERFNALLKRHGYDRDTATTEQKTDGDHVCELQMVGASGDCFANLWPLNASENRSSGSTLSQTTVTLGDGKPQKVRELAAKQYWFQISSFSR